MNWKKQLSVLVAIVALLLLKASSLWAGDCSSATDCIGTPDNGTKAAVVGGILCGYGLYVRSQRKKDDNPEFGEGEASDLTVLFGGGDAGGGDPSTTVVPPGGGDPGTTPLPPGGQNPGDDISNQPLGGDDPTVDNKGGGASGGDSHDAAGSDP